MSGVRSGAGITGQITAVWIVGQPNFRAALRVIEPRRFVGARGWITVEDDDYGAGLQRIFDAEPARDAKPSSRADQNEDQSDRERSATASWENHPGTEG
jgi:hypothetical protein